MSTFKNINITKLIYSNFYLNEIESFKTQVRSTPILTAMCRQSTCEVTFFFFNENRICLFYDNMNMNLYIRKKIPLTTSDFEVNMIQKLTCGTKYLILTNQSLLSYDFATDKLKYIYRIKTRISIVQEGDGFVVLYKQGRKWFVKILDRKLMLIKSFEFTIGFTIAEKFLYNDYKLILINQDKVAIEYIDLWKGISVQSCEVNSINFNDINWIMGGHLLFTGTNRFIIYDIATNGQLLNAQQVFERYIIKDDSSLIIISDGWFYSLKLEYKRHRISCSPHKLCEVNVNYKDQLYYLKLLRHEQELYLVLGSLINVYNIDTMELIHQTVVDYFPKYINNTETVYSCITGNYIEIDLFPLRDPRKTICLKDYVPDFKDAIDDIEWRDNCFAISTEKNIFIFNHRSRKHIKTFERGANTKFKFITAYRFGILNPESIIWYDILSDKTTEMEYQYHEEPIGLLGFNSLKVIILYTNCIRIVSYKGRPVETIYFNGLKQIYRLYQNDLLFNMEEAIKFYNLKTRSFYDANVKKENREAMVVDKFDFKRDRYFLLNDNRALVCNKELRIKEIKFKPVEGDIALINEVNEKNMLLFTAEKLVYELNISTGEIQKYEGNRYIL
jgi:hypothetical protein